jgi:hypothetical protein
MLPGPGHRPRSIRRLVFHSPGFQNLLTGRLMLNPQGGDWFRLWSSMQEKRAVVPGATLKSRDKKQMPSLNSRWLLNT